MDTRAIEAQRRRDAGEQGYVVFLILHVFFMWGLLYEGYDPATPIESWPWEFWLILVAAIMIVILLSAYTFAASRFSFRTTLSLTIIWLAIVGGWLISRALQAHQGALAAAYVFLLYASYAILFSLGLKLKIGSTKLASPSNHAAPD